MDLSVRCKNEIAFNGKLRSLRAQFKLGLLFHTHFPFPTFPFSMFYMLTYSIFSEYFHIYPLGLLDTLFMTGLNDNRWLVKPSESSFMRLECDLHIVILKVVKSNL